MSEPYASLEELKSHLSITDDVDDDALTRALVSATAMVNRFTKVTFPVDPEDDVPEEVIEATLIQASRLFARRSSPFGIAGGEMSGGEVMLRNQLDVDVQQLLMAHRVLVLE